MQKYKKSNKLKNRSSMRLVMCLLFDLTLVQVCKDLSKHTWNLSYSLNSGFSKKVQNFRSRKQRGYLCPNLSSWNTANNTRTKKEEKKLPWLFEEIKAYVKPVPPTQKSIFKNHVIYRSSYNVKPRKGSTCGHLEKEALLITVCRYLLGIFILRLNNNKEYLLFIYFLLWNSFLIIRLLVS